MENITNILGGLLYSTQTIIKGSTSRWSRNDHPHHNYVNYIIINPKYIIVISYA